MREILFRGKRDDNGEWVVSDCIMQFHGVKFAPRLWAIGDWWVDVIPETVGQFTGAIDKNGKRIFEGDIGRYKQTDGAKRNGKLIICTGKVVYRVKTASFAVESKDEKGVEYFDYFPIKDFEIIGNIHDNPELLKGGEK